MLIVEKAGGPIKKLLGLKKKKRLSRLTVSLLPWQESTSPPVGMLKKPEEIVVINDQVVQPPVLRPPVQT